MRLYRIRLSPYRDGFNSRQDHHARGRRNPEPAHPASRLPLLPITADWQTLCSPFFKRVYGTNQVTDAYLLGLAVREDLVLVTMDKGILHLAGPEHRKHVLLLAAK